MPNWNLPYFSSCDIKTVKESVFIEFGTGRYAWFQALSSGLETLPTNALLFHQPGVSCFKSFKADTQIGKETTATREGTVLSLRQSFH